MDYQYGKQDFELLMKKTKHSIDIVTALYDRNTLTHKELYEYLHIKKNNLSNVIKKLEPFNILFIRKIGKNVYYSLNAKGVEFYHFIESFKNVVPETRIEKSLEFVGLNKWKKEER